MSDPTSALSAISPEYLDQLRLLMGQMAPNSEDKRAALSHGLLQAGFGILANAANNPWVAVGKGASSGLLSYNDEIKQLQAQRNQNLQAASQVQGLAQKSRMDGIVTNAIQRFLPGAQGQQTGQPANGANVVTTPITSTGEPGQPMPQDQGQPQAQPQQSAGMSRSDAASLGTILTLAKGGDMNAANNFMFPKVEMARAGAGYQDPATGKFYPGGTAPPGWTFNPQTQKLEKMQGGDEAFQSAKARDKAVDLSFEQPKEVVDPVTGNKSIPPGTLLGQLFGNQDLPYGARSPYGQQGTVDPAVAAFAAKSGAGPRDFLGGLGRNGQPATLPIDGGTAGTQSGAGRTTELGPASKTFLTGRAENALKQEQGIDDAASAAQMDMARNKEVRNLVSNFKPGALTPLRGEAGAIAAAAGLPDSVVTGIAGGNVAAIQAMGKLVVDGAFDSAKVAMAGGGRVTQAEILLKAKNSPNAQLTPEAITAMLDFKDGVNMWNVQKQAAKEEWIASHGNSSVGFMADWNKTHPLTNYTPSDAQLEAALFPNGKPSAGPVVQNSTAIMNAKKAIQNGADPAAVKARLQQNGVDTSGL